MSPFSLSRRAALGGALGVTSLALSPKRLRAASLRPVKLTLAWYAQAPVGGFFQALARGYYRDAGLDVTIANGGPQVNAVQILLAGETDFITGYDFQTLHGIEKGMPLVTVATSFQHDLQGMILHKPAASLAELKGRRVLIASSSRQTFWPWLRDRYGLNDAQLAPYTFNLQPFLTSPNVAFQGYASSEMFDLSQQNVAARFFQFSDDGYPPYGTPLVTSRNMSEKDPELTAAFVKASMMGWRDYLHGDPSPGNALIQQASTRESPERMAWGIRALRDAKVLTGGDAALTHIGMMTETRWQATYDFMVKHQLIASGVKWQDAFTTRFVDAAGVTPA